ncbi:MarR family winged helix-turn-helix transcriptional regulator [Spirosoma pomorum]
MILTEELRQEKKMEFAKSMGHLVSFNIQTLALGMARYSNRELGRMGFSLQLEQLPILFIAYFCADEAPSQQNIADLLQKDKSGVQRSIKTLERDGYLRIVNDQDDRRKNLIQLTPAGRLVVEKVQEAAKTMDHAVTKQLSEEELTQFLTVSRKISSYLEQQF